MYSDEDLASRFRQHAIRFSRARATSMTFLVQFGAVGLMTKIRDGAVIAIDAVSERPPLASVDFVIQAPAQAWMSFWEPVPKAGRHDIFALTRHGLMSIQGNLHPFMSNLQFVKDLLAVGRGTLP